MEGKAAEHAATLATVQARAKELKISIPTVTGGSK